MVYFYILYSAMLDRYYPGHTGEALDERLRKHLSAHSGWTSRAKDRRLVHSEPIATKSEAYRRELEVKGWKSRPRLEALFRAAR